MNMLDPTFKKMILEMDPGLEKVVLLTLSEHVGREKAISRYALVEEVQRYLPAHERQVRMTISELRKAGWLIASAAGSEGGYFIPKDRAEFNSFLESEFEAKIKDMAVTKNAMVRGADKVFGRYYQEVLF